MARLRDLLPGVPLVESPLFYSMIDELGLNPQERRVASELHERGYAVIDFPDDQLADRIDRIVADLGPKFDVAMADPETIKNSGAVQRIQDAWTFNDDVRAIAANPQILNLLSKLYGRGAFPFQTLNFPVGTQQALHSDTIHFSSIPERFMCGVWLALEDVGPDAGPLTYLPGSHKWPVLSNTMIGRRGFKSDRRSAQDPFQCAWDALASHSDTKQELFLARKGQALIWAANLLHGGSSQRNPRLTRWSQVTHYYFEDCMYYTPAFSDEPLGELDLRVIVDAETEKLKPQVYLGEPIECTAESRPSRSLIGRLRAQLRNARLPKDFDRSAYYRLNPDVSAANVDAETHYLRHGRYEGRRYRFR